ncbi:hypothetical protein V8F06_009908 [Rhypophila decipiens]
MPLAFKSLAIFGAIWIFSTSAVPAAPPPSGDGTIADDENTTVVAHADADNSPLRARETQLCAMLCANHYFQGDCEVFCTQDLQCGKLNSFGVISQPRELHQATYHEEGAGYRPAGLFET